MSPVERNEEGLTPFQVRTQAVDSYQAGNFYELYTKLGHDRWIAEGYSHTPGLRVLCKYGAKVLAAVGGWDEDRLLRDVIPPWEPHPPAPPVPLGRPAPGVRQVLDHSQSINGIPRLIGGDEYEDPVTRAAYESRWAFGDPDVDGSAE